MINRLYNSFQSTIAEKMAVNFLKSWIVFYLISRSLDVERFRDYEHNSNHDKTTEQKLTQTPERR